MGYLGVDLHSNNFLVERLEVIEGKMLSQVSKYNLEGESFKSFVNSLNTEDYILVESSSNAFWFYDQVVDRVKKCYIYNVNEARNKGNKTDKIDCKTLAEKLAFFVILGEDKSKLSTVYIPEPKVRELRGLVSSYRLMGKLINQVKNRIYALLKQNGIRVEKRAIDINGFNSYFEELNLSDVWKYQIRILLSQLKNTEDEQKKIKDMIYILGDELFHREIELLLSIRGVSPFTAIVLMSDVVDVNRFPNHKKFCAYLRTAPKIKGSNETTHMRSINKQSRSASCSLLTQSVNHFKIAGDHMSDFYNRVKVGKSAGKSRIALIRKILVSSYHILKNDKLYYWVENDLYKRKLETYQKELKKIKLSLNFEEKIKKIA